jgi:hypothetical protein
MGVSGRPTRASAFSTDSDTPLCSDHPNENSAANAKVEAARVTFLKFCFMDFSP